MTPLYFTKKVVIILISKFKKRILIIIAIFFAFCVVSMAATKIIYDNIFARYDEAAVVPESLTQMVGKRQVCSFPSGENLLTGYYYPAEEPGSAHGLIVLVPGFRAGGDNYLWQISELLDYGWAVFTFDPTGTLRSQGESQVGFSQTVFDLEAALKYVEKSGCFGYNELVLIGHSRGAYAACCVLEQEHEVAAVVSISGANSAMEAIMEMSTDTVGLISYGNYGFLWLYQVMLFGSDTVNLDASRIISRGAVPVLIVHGSADKQVDSSSILSNKDEIDSEQVEYLICDAGHTDLMYDTDGTANNALIKSIHEFLLRSINR